MTKIVASLSLAASCLNVAVAEAETSTPEEFIDMLNGCIAFVRGDGREGAGTLIYTQAPKLLCDSCSTGFGMARLPGTELSAKLGLRSSPKTLRSGKPNPRWGGIDASCQTSSEGSPAVEEMESQMSNWMQGLSSQSSFRHVPRSEAAYAKNPIDNYYICNEDASPIGFYILSEETARGSVPIFHFDARSGAEFCLGGQH